MSNLTPRPLLSWWVVNLHYWYRSGTGGVEAAFLYSFFSYRVCFPSRLQCTVYLGALHTRFRISAAYLLQRVQNQEHVHEDLGVYAEDIERRTASLGPCRQDAEAHLNPREEET